MPTINEDFGISLQIDEEIYNKIMFWVNKSNFEVSGLGKIVYDKEANVFKVVDAIILPQTNTSSETDIDPQAICKAMFAMKDSEGELKWWWHSHVDMGVFWSGTDKGTMEELSSQGWFVATVFNKKNEMKTAFCQSSPIKIVVDDIKTIITTELDEELTAKWNKEYEDNVKNVQCEYVSANHSIDSMSYGAYGQVPFWEREGYCSKQNDKDSFDKWLMENRGAKDSQQFKFEFDDEDEDIKELKKQGYIFADDDDDDEKKTEEEAMDIQSVDEYFKRKVGVGDD